MSTGLGTASAGSSPVGFGDADDAPTAPVVSLMSRYIDPATRDYRVNETTGAFARMPPVRQRAMLAVMTVLGSSTGQADWGLRRPPKMGSNFEQQLESELRRALYRLTDTEQVMRIESIQIERDTIRALARIHYMDLTTGQKDDVTSG